MEAAPLWFAHAPPGIVLDLGCGLGGPALFFARTGRRVVAVDASESAIGRLRATASSESLAIKTVRDDIRAFPLEESYAVVHMRHVLHFLTVTERSHLIRRLQKATVQGGVHCIAVFTEDGALKSPRFHWATHRELLRLYEGWTLLADEERLTGTSTLGPDGRPLSHTVLSMVFVKPPLHATTVQ